MNRKAKWSVAVLTATALISGGILYGSNVTMANVQNPKPIGAEQQNYVLNPDPVLKSNINKKDQLLSTKDNILKKIKLKNTEKIISTQLKTWKEYNVTEGDNAKNFEVADDRMVWEIKINSPEGVDTRGGFFKNAIKTYIIDAETEKLIEMYVKGDRDPNSGPFQNQNGKKIN